MLNLTFTFENEHLRTVESPHLSSRNRLNSHSECMDSLGSSPGPFRRRVCLLLTQVMRGQGLEADLALSRGQKRDAGQKGDCSSCQQDSTTRTEGCGSGDLCRAKARLIPWLKAVWLAAAVGSCLRECPKVGSHPLPLILITET